MVRLIPARAGVLVALVCGLTLGCGGDKTYRVSGKVTFKGQPIPAGKIYFIPDGAKGHTGPTGYANIVDGQYDTSAAGGMGAISGPMIVAIEGIDTSAKGKVEKGDTSGEETFKALFPRYETTYDVPASASTKDFDVPADAVKGTPKKGPAIIIP